MVREREKAENTVISIRPGTIVEMLFFDKKGQKGPIKETRNMYTHTYTYTSNERRPE